MCVGTLQGVCVDVLLTTAGMLSHDKKFTLLDFIMAQALKKSASMLDLHRQLTSVGQAAQVQVGMPAMAMCCGGSIHVGVFV